MAILYHRYGIMQSSRDTSICGQGQRIDFLFLGTYIYRPRNEGSNTKKGPHELDNNGLVPLPAKLCNACSK